MKKNVLRQRLGQTTKALTKTNFEKAKEEVAAEVKGKKRTRKKV